MFLLYRWLIKYPGFEFDLEPRDPLCLPKEFSNVDEGTCYFLRDYHHPSITQQELSLDAHIQAAMSIINANKE